MVRLTVLLLALTGMLACKTLDESLTNVKPGDCVVDPGLVDEVMELETVDCTAPGALKVLNTFELTSYTEFPGDLELDTIADNSCHTDATVWMVPTKESWDFANDRLVACFEE